MQSSVASKLPSLVLRRRSSYRRPLSYCRQFQPRLFLQTPEDQYSNSNSNSNSNDHGCIGIGIDHNNNNNNNNNSHHHNSFRKQIHGTSCEQQQQQQQQQRHHYKRQPRRIHSTLASTSFWRGLHQAVRQGNGNHAEEIAEQVLRDFYRFSSQSQSSDADAVTEAVAGNRNGNGNEWMSHDYNYDYNNNGTLSIDSESGNAHAYAHASSSPSPLLLDSQIFSLVLQAWKNSDHGSMHSALRAHNLLIQMAALADQDVLCDPPTPEDYTAVLECWHRASEHDGDSNSDSDSNGNGNGNNNTTKPNSNSNGSGSGLSLIVQHAEELWTQMKERQRREAMTNKSEHFSIDEKAYELFASLLAGAGKAAQAEEVVREAVAQGQWQQHGYGYGGPNYALADPKSDGNSNNSSSNNNNNNTRAEEKHGTPRVGLNLCHAVLRAHLASKETRASERADAFLQQMVTDPALPNPTVDSYNLLLERWMMSSKATTRKHDVNANANASVQIAGRIEDLIHQMKETSRIQPNLTSYQYGIDALARSGQAIRAETMLAHLVKDYLLQYDADLKPSIAPFQSVLWAYSRAATATGGPGHRRLADAAERAESILNNMKELSTLVDTYPTVWSYNIVLKCWANSRSPDAVARTMALYEELRSAQRERQEQQPRETDDGDDETTTTIQFEPESDPSAILPPEDLMPDTTTMNTVLNILSKGRDGALRTEQKLWEFYDAHVQDPKRNPRPDTIAFSTAINAWSNTPDADSPYRAEALLQKMIDLNNNNNNNNDNRKYKPDIVTYTNVMQSWIKSKKPEAPEKSEAILRDLQRMQRDGDKRMKPDAACWNSAISAWATAGNGERAEALFFEMVDGSKTPRSDGASPTSITLTNVLRAWVKTRSHHASDRAIALLAKMEQYYRDGILAVKPNGVNYSVVLDCLAYSRKSSTAERAETMLQRMEASDDPKMHPSVVSYNSVIKAWSYTRDPRSATKITALLRHLIDRSEANPEMRPNENTFGVILKFLADSDLPDKEQRARAIQNLMKKFLDREPKPWVMNEFKKCLSSSNQVERGSPLFVDRIDYNNNTQQQSQARSSELPKRHKDDTLDQPTKNSDITRSNTVATQCRERRANKRFSSEIRKKNLTFQPISGKPETDEEEFQSGTVGNNKFNVRDALVRVRLSGKTTLEPPKQRTSRYHDQKENHSFSFLVVDGESEYSCKVPDVDKNYTPDIRGGQFLNISYYWLCGEPVVVAMKDAVTGHEIPR